MTKQYQYFFINRVVKLWNDLPEDIVNEASLNVFKNKVDYLLKNYMYLTNSNTRAFVNEKQQET